MWPILALLVLGGALLSLPPPAEGQFAWEVHLIEGGVRSSGATSLALDSEGRPHIAYNDLGRASVVYARWTGFEWVVETAAQEGFPLGMVSLALDERDLPHISFFDAQDRRIKYANFDGFAWRVLTVNKSHFEGYSSIALDPEGTPHIAFAWDAGRLALARLSGATWSTEVADRNVVVARYPSLAFNSSGRPQIAYYGNGVLFYTEWIGYRWLREIVDEDPSPQFVNLALDAADVPKIAYRSSIAREVRFAWREGGTWRWEVVDTEGDTGWDSGFALDKEGDPHISYYERDQAVLKYAYKIRDKWFVRIVDQSGIVGWYSSMAVGSDGRPHFAYYSWTDRTMRYAFGDFALGIRTWAPREVTPTSVQLVGEVTSMGDATQLEVFFEYRTPDGNWTQVDAGIAVDRGFVTAALADLTPEVTYEYRVVGFTEGVEVRGDIFTFATPAIPPPEPIIPLPALLGLSVAIIVGLVVGYAVLQWRRRVRETPNVGRPRGLYSGRSQRGGKNP